MGNKVKKLRIRETMEREGMMKRSKRLIRRSDQGAACGHPYERRDDEVSWVEMMILGCDDLHHSLSLHCLSNPQFLTLFPIFSLFISHFLRLMKHRVTV